MIDFSADTTVAQGEDVLSTLSRLANEQIQLEKQIAAKEQELKELQKQLDVIADVQIPELMDSVGMKECKTKEGLPVKVVEKVRASITGAKNAMAIQWLEEHGFGNIIKRDITVPFNKDEEERAFKFLRLAEENHFMAAVANKVHPQTLEAFVREQLAAGTEIPLDTFGVYTTKRAKIG